jgi:hypothetical protein
VVADGAIIPLEVHALSPCRRLGWVVAASVSLLAVERAMARADEGGGLVGWVESTQGSPVAGAVVSVFGKGIRGGSLITLADSAGRFTLPSLPAGSYTLRAVGSGHEPSAAQRVTVLPNRDALFTLSLAPVGDKAPEDAASPEAASEEARREWRWLVRHKRRSVLETESHDVEAADRAAAPAGGAPALADLGTLAGSMEFAATAGARSLAEPSGLGLPGGLGSLRLQGRLADGVRWNLGGLVAESEGRAWRMAAEFVIDPGGGHEIEVGAGYGAGDSRQALADATPEPTRTLGAAFVRDRWRLSERLTATAGARYTYVGFLPDSHHADAVVQIEVRGDRHTRLHGSVATRTLAPGGDLLTLSTVAASPAITWARLEDGLRPARSMTLELGIDRAVGDATLGARIFDEAADDVLLTTFEGTTPVIRNAGRAGARGFGVSLGHRLGNVVSGSVTYTFGRGRRSGAAPLTLGVPVMAFDQSEFHDLVARLETVIDWSDTRVAAFYRLNALSDDAPPTTRPASASTTSSRFDVQLTQGLPFLQPLTRADWEVLVAVRNMFYEASQAGFLDELAVQDPPTRVVGGISVRF